MKTFQLWLGTLVAAMVWTHKTIAIEVDSSPEGSPAIYVAGADSDNIVKFDYLTGEAQVAVQLPSGAHPRGLALDGDGAMYIATLGADKNILKATPKPDAPDAYSLRPLTQSIGNFGPGFLQFHDSGDLIAGGDQFRAILRIDPETGEITNRYPASGCCNNVGILVDGDVVYSAETLQDKIYRVNLSDDPVRSSLVVDRSSRVARPVGMTIGHNGNLFIANNEDALIQEFDPLTGAFLGTFIDLSTVGGSPTIEFGSDIHFEPSVNRYFATSTEDAIYEFDIQGNLIRTLQSPLLEYGRQLAFVQGVEVVPEPSAASLAGSVVLLSIAWATRRRRLAATRRT